MAARLELTAVFEPVEEGWIQATVAELPGVITAAPTMQEAKELLLDALGEYLRCESDDGSLPLDDGRYRERLAVTFVS